MSDNADDRIKGGRFHAAEEPRTHHQGLGFDFKKGATRRGFLKGAAMGTAGLIAGKRLLQAGSASAQNRNSKVVRTYHDGATTGWTQVNQEPVDLLVHAAIRELTGIGDTAGAWASLFPGLTVDKKISIKINLACGDVPTHPEVVNAIIDGILMVDIGGETLPEENIIVWDMDDPFFCAQTGYTRNWGGPGVQYVGCDHSSVGYDTGHTFQITHPGGTSTHRPSKIITQHSDYIINAGVIKDHGDSEITFCLKNHFGSFNGIGTSTRVHGEGHNRTEAELSCFLRDDLGDKVVLNLIDATYGLFQGGPGYIPPYHTPPNWIYNSLFVSFDVVAIDRMCTEAINVKRQAEGYSLLDPSMVTNAAEPPYSLGESKVENIDFVEVDAADMTDIVTSGLGANGAVLFAPYPNPSQGPSTLRFSVESDVHAEMLITDVRGRLVCKVAAGTYPQGMHRCVWDGKDTEGRTMPSGVYFARLKTSGGIKQRKLVRVR
ncbi:MAG: DUF362 domain-containing protein [bacterium]|nr:DUF362 domain-containing protein [bacterium]